MQGGHGKIKSKVSEKQLAGLRKLIFTKKNLKIQMNILQQCYDFKILHSCICK
jgi:hypothetical protein